MDLLGKKMKELVDGAQPPPSPTGSDEEESDGHVENVTSHVPGAEDVKTPDKGISKHQLGSGMSTASRATSRTSLGDSGDAESHGELDDRPIWEQKITKYDIVAVLSGQKMGK